MKSYSCLWSAHRLRHDASSVDSCSTYTCIVKIRAISMMNEEILDLINLNVSAKLMAAWVCVLLLLCTSSAAISCTIHKLILQRTILLISHNALRLGCSHERCIVASIVSSWSTHHDQILSLVLSTTQLRPWSRRWIRHAIPDVLDGFIHIGCSFLATLLWCNNLDSICSGYWSIWMDTAWEKRLVHLFHKRVEQNFSFFAAQDISLILDCSCLMIANLN